AILIAVATTELTRIALERITASRRRDERAALARSLRPVIGAIVAAAVIVPSLVVHYRAADHRGPPLADVYAEQVLAAVPQRGVLLVWGAEFGMPITYRQVVFHERRDVTVIS